MKRLFLQRLVAAAVFFALLVTAGVVGYGRIEGWGFLDSLYMTVTTLTSVGYMEVHPLSEPGRTFTMVLLMGGVTGLGIWFALLTSLIVELDLADIFKKRRMMKELEQLRDHVIVCGVGRTGRQVVEELVASHQDFVVVDSDPQALEMIREIAPDAPMLAADATQDHNLELAGISRAAGLITCLSSDTDNLFVCLSARALEPRLRIVARAMEEEVVPKLHRAGANHVVSPTLSGATRMAAALIRPSVASFLDVATRTETLSLRIEQAEVTPGSPLAGKTLQEAEIPRETGLIVIAMRKKGTPEGEFVFNPVADTVLEEGDHLIVLGRREQIEGLRRYVR